MAGRSRSATLTIAYLLWKDGCKGSECKLNGILESVQKKRPIVQPNTAFMEQLVAWEDELKSNKMSQRTMQDAEEMAIHEIMKVTHRIKEEMLTESNKATEQLQSISRHL